ncbi:hypothetical protein Tco_1509621 [Tanacetum coccineum]
MLNPISEPETRGERMSSVVKVLSLSLSGLLSLRLNQEDENQGGSVKGGVTGADKKLSVNTLVNENRIAADVV